MMPTTHGAKRKVMKMEVDLYEVKAELVKRRGQDITDWIMAHGTPKAAYVVTVGEDMPVKLADALREHETEDGEAVMVIVQ